MDLEYLAGVMDLAELLGVDHSTVTSWMRRYESFPQPLVKLRSCRVWDIRDVLEWAVANSRVSPQDASRLTTKYRRASSERLGG